jgi:hypothetical protein
MLADLVPLDGPFFHPAVDSDPVHVEEIGHFRCGKEHLRHGNTSRFAFIRDTVATYISSATTAPVLSSQNGGTLVSFAESHDDEKVRVLKRSLFF